MKKMIPLFVIAIFLLGIMAGFWLNHNMTPFQKETNWAVAIEHVMPATVSITATRIEDATTTTTRA